MKCPNCQNDNPAEAKFCMTCGSALAKVCSNCGTQLPAEAAFCFNCGQKVAKTQEAAMPQPQPDVVGTQSYLHQYIPRELLAKLDSARNHGTMEGERRIVTMLFCDVKGSTAAAERLDPEEWAEIINGAFEHLIRPVYRYEGTVARLMGDGILAFFGAPIAHEDDPQRAVLAGLDILHSIQDYRRGVKSRWDLDIDVRVGINTGLVVVGAVGSDLRMEYTALGDAINLAARMEQTARPGTVQIAEDTYKLVTPLFEVKDLGAIEVKGKIEPVRAYQVLRLKAEPGRLRGIEGLEAPLVGRDREMHALRGAIIELGQGRGQIISVIGEAGLGKSRLITELRKSSASIADSTAGLQWIEGRSLSYETSTPYAPFIRLLEDCFGLGPEQTSEEKYLAITQKVNQTMPGQVGEISPFLASLLGITLAGKALERVRFLEPPQLRTRVFQATRDYFESLAAERPLVLVFDDLHWVDPTSLELLEQLLPLSDRAMLLIITLFRPRKGEPSWQLHEIAEREYGHRYMTIRIKPLDFDDSRELVAHLLHVEGLPDNMRNLILTKADGNPFFLEEVIRSLLDAKVIVKQNGHWRATREIDDIAVPDTLAAVLTTRLDRLDEESKKVIQTASVIGRQFQLNTLADIYGSGQMLEDSLTTLQRRELIREKSRFPQRLFMFKHVLTQETAYSSLLLRKRRELHRRVGESLERRAPDRVNDIARHFREAGDSARALPYYLAAADRAAHAYSTAEAIGFYEAALEILEAVDDLASARRAYEGLGSALTFANEIPRAIQTYQTMLDLAEARDDVPMQVSALNKLSFISALRLGQFDQAEGYLSESDRLARENEDKVGLSEMGLIRCMMCTAVADFEGVVRYMEEMVSISRELAIKEQMSLGMAHIAASQIFMLQFDDGWRTIQEGLKFSREIGDREHEADLLASTLPLYYSYQGQHEAARQAALEGLEIAKRIGSIQALPLAYRALGSAVHQQGYYEQAITHYEDYLQASRQGELIWFEADALCLLGTAYLDISPALYDRVAEFHDRAEQLLAYPGGAMLGASAWAEVGSCALLIGKLQKAADLFQQGLDIPSITMNLERPRLLHGQALVAMAQGELEAATSSLATARSIAEKHGLKNYYPLIAVAEARLKIAGGDPLQALEKFAEAEVLSADMGLRPMLWQACNGASHALAMLGRTDEAVVKRGQAQSTIEEMAKLFEDEALKAQFTENATGQLLHGVVK